MKNINFNSDKDFETRAMTIKKVMLELGIANADLIKGCSKEKIIQLEKKNNVIFPASYKVFLENFGHGLGGYVMNDIDILYENISGLTNLLRNDILVEDDEPILPDKAFVFAGRYGEQFMFFETDTEGDEKEPPIFYYHMNHDYEFSKVGNSIFDVLEKEIELSYELKIETEKRRKKK